MIQRQRERHYEAFVGVRVPESVKDRLDALADRERVALGIIVRRVLEAGLPVIERGEGGARNAMMAEARTWWEGQTPDQRRAWHKRLPGLKGRDLIAGAWTQARGQ